MNTYAAVIKKVEPKRKLVRELEAKSLAAKQLLDLKVSDLMASSLK